MFIPTILYFKIISGILRKLYMTALMSATRGGHTEIVKLLLEQEGIDINTQGVCFNNLIFQNHHWNLMKL